MGDVCGIGFNRNRIFYLHGGAGMKGYCRYLVIDKTTGMKLVCGEKWKEFSELTFCGTFRARCGGLRKCTVAQYMQERKVGGIDCVIVYWIYATPKEPRVCSVVSPFGQFLGLKGNLYELFPRRFLKAYDYRKILIRHGIWK